MVTLLLIICLRFVVILGSCPDFTEALKAECAQREVVPPVIDATCPDLPTIFLLGPTRNGKSHFANALLAYSINRKEIDHFGTSESAISHTSSIQCKCGHRYRVCDSPGIPDHCYRADIYLDQIVTFLKEEKPALNVFVLAHKTITEKMTKKYYDALKKCVVEFSNITTYILLNQVTSRKDKLEQQKHHYDKEIQEQAALLGIKWENHMFHPSERWSLTESQIEIVNSLLINPQNMDTSSYKTWTNLVQIVTQNVDVCVERLIEEKNTKIQNALEYKKWYENIQKYKSLASYFHQSDQTTISEKASYFHQTLKAALILSTLAWNSNQYSWTGIAVGGVYWISDMKIQFEINRYEERSITLKKEKEEIENNKDLQIQLCKEKLAELQEIGNNLCIRDEKIEKDVRKHAEL